MTEQTTTETTEDEQTEETTEVEQQKDENDLLDDEQPEGKQGNSEAAKWRVKLREAEAQIATLSERVSTMHASEVSRLATGPGKLHDGADLLTSTKLDDVLDDDGQVDPELVATAVAALAEKKPHLACPAFAGGVGVGQMDTTTGGATWAGVFQS